MKPFFSSSSSKYKPPETNAELSGSFHFQVRAAKTRDLAGIAEILADSFHSRKGLGVWIYPLLRLGIYEDLRNRLQSNSSRYVCLVAVEAACIRSDECNYSVGTLEMSLRSTYPWPLMGVSQYPYISNLAVRSECRRQGVAKQLLLTCEQIAVGWGFQDIYLHVLENNHKARRLYFKLGYRLHQIDSGWSSLLLGQPRRLLLRKQLSSK